MSHKVYGDLEVKKDLTVDGDFTVNGTTTTINTVNLDVEDHNITINKGGNDLTSVDAGLTIERTTENAVILHDDTLLSKFKIGAESNPKEIIVDGFDQNIGGTKTFTDGIVDQGDLTVDGTSILNGQILANDSIVLSHDTVDFIQEIYTPDGTTNTTTLVIRTGDSASTYSSGDLEFRTGATDLADTGNVDFSTGTATTGNSGGISFQTGDGDNSGDINLSTGGATGTRGAIYLSGEFISAGDSRITDVGAPTTNDNATNKLYVDTQDGTTLSSANSYSDTKMSTHESAVNPHAQYLTQAEGDLLYDALGDAAAAVTAHEGESDPHPQYLTPAEGNVAYEPAGSVSTHEAALDPHTQYLKESDASSTYQPLDTQLTDLSGLSYTGNASKVIRVNATENGFELVTPTTGANTTLSNLTTTAVNIDIVPDTTGSKNLGSSVNKWNNLYALKIIGSEGIDPFFLISTEDNTYTSPIFMYSGEATSNSGEIHIKSGNSGSGSSGDVTLETGSSFVSKGRIRLLGSSIDANNTNIENVATPTATTDAVNKTYVDTNFQPLDTQLTSLAALSYAGNASKLVAVNGTATGFELIVAPATGANTSLSNLSAVNINTSLTPDTDSTYDLGTLSSAWNNIYVNNISTNTGDLIINGSNLIPLVNNSVTLGSHANYWGTTHSTTVFSQTIISPAGSSLFLIGDNDIELTTFSGIIKTVNTFETGNIVPNGNLTRDIGSSTAYYNNIYTDKIVGTGMAQIDFGMGSFIYGGTVKWNMGSNVFADTFGFNSIDVENRKLINGAGSDALNWSGVTILSSSNLDFQNTSTAINLANPTNAQDAATKNYVDTGFQPLSTVSTISSNTTLDNTHRVVLASGNTTLTLPAASSNANRIYYIKKTDATNTITIDGNASETIDGSLTKTLSIQYESVTIVCNGSNWYII